MGKGFDYANSLLDNRCKRIEQPYASKEEDAIPGDWYLKRYTTDLLDTYAIYEFADDEDEEVMISSDYTLEELIGALQLVEIFISRYNENIQ